MGLSRDQEKAMFAGSGNNGKGIRRKQIVTGKTPIVKGIRFKKNEKTLEILFNNFDSKTKSDYLAAALDRISSDGGEINNKIERENEKIAKELIKEFDTLEKLRSNKYGDAVKKILEELQQNKHTRYKKEGIASWWNSLQFKVQDEILPDKASYGWDDLDKNDKEHVMNYYHEASKGNGMFGNITKEKEERLIKQMKEDWNNRPTLKKQQTFEHWMLYRQNYMNPDNEENWAKYNYGDISFDKLPDGFKIFTIGSPYEHGMKYMVNSPKHGKRYFENINDGLIFGNAEGLEVLPLTKFII